MAKNTATKSAPAADIVTGESEIDILRATLAERGAEIERLTVALQSAEMPEGARIRLARDTEYDAAYTHLRAHETPAHLVCRLLLEKKKTPQ